jgi:hypothetical protein
MSSPTLKDLIEAFPKIDKSKLKELVEVLSAPDALAENDDEYLKAVDEAMEKANEILDGHGVEAAQGEGSNLGKYWRDTILVYVNLGDTYDTTICYDPDEEEFIVGSWGDFIEAWEQEDDDEDEEEDVEEEEDSEEEDAETEEAE